MSDKSIPVKIRPVEAGNVVEQKWCGALLVYESLCSIDGKVN